MKVADNARAMMTSQSDPEPALRCSHRGDDQTELAVVGQAQGCEQGGTCPQLEAGQEQVEERDFQGRHGDQERCDTDRRHGRHACQADRQEKADQQQILEAHQGLGQLRTLVMTGQKNAENQGAEICLQADQFETAGTGDQRGEQAEQQE